MRSLCPAGASPPDAYPAHAPRDETNAMQSTPQHPSQDLPVELPFDRTAFFFDFDGTLVDLAPTPDGVLVQPDMLALLGALRRATHGAVAIVSGRGIDSIDSFLGMPDLPIAGLHGAERRDANGDTQRVGFNDQRLLHMEQVLAEVVRTHAGMLLEIKGAALALHYRNAPEHENTARAATEKLAAEFADAYVLQPGKMVYEIKPKDVDKGRALRAFLNEPPFAGRTPVFAGDDLTDEKGFAVVNEMGGLSIKVGGGETIARTRVESVDALLAWLAALGA
ncbi:trehalose 6-phosphatase [Paraburkholderia eburnea]|uniref:Trehalose 6-phosphate phosphatase n=2 Tax=Paraburkholderia eburnea TaxID=1189126 RepID=A0A2S4M2W5_9BURK|nr:trehalose 6-phosphatase [Paraburkholderia eburnea]PRZ19435.1 trehalose 6-phosphatase [Paraburkholderia eburnea]